MEGWARLSEIVQEEEPQSTRLRYIKSHVMLTKYFKGGYIEAIMYGRVHPAYGGFETRERKIEHQSWADYQVGSRIVVSYPTMKSKHVRRATSEARRVKRVVEYVLIGLFVASLLQELTPPVIASLLPADVLCYGAQLQPP